MSRYIPEHPKKGSTEAYAWAAKMQEARAKKKRLRHTIRQAGLKTEQEFFGPGGPLAPKTLRKHKLNPGQQWHEGMAAVAGRHKRQAQDKLEKVMFAGMEVAHADSAAAARKLGMNPTLKPKPEWYYDAGSGSYILDLKHASYQIRKDGEKFRCAFVVGSTVEYIRSADSVKEAMDKIDYTQGKKFKRPKQFNKNPIAVFNPSKVAGTIYNNAIEIKAQKTGGPLKGHYKHVFGSNVRILGLTDGTVLLQHKNGKPLWITRKDYERTGRKH